jgi:hypothetical protein
MDDLKMLFWGVVGRIALYFAFGFLLYYGTWKLVLEPAVKALTEAFGAGTGLGF